MSKPKILIIDIETTPIVAYCWDLFDQNISIEQIVKDWNIMSFAAKWYGSNKMIYMDQRNEKHISDDRKMVKEIARLLDEADIVLGQNSKGFDTKKINSRIKFHNSSSKQIKMPSPYRHIDLLLLNKKYFKDTSNKLEYQSKKYNKKYKKLDHKEYPGFKMWRAAMEGDKKVWPVIEKYNKFDVLATEELYKVLQPWDSSINFSVYTEDLAPVCNCGSTEFMKDGFTHTGTAKYQVYACKSCGAHSKGRTNLLLSKDIKKLRASIPR